jgi:uncharacterized 2Fe-2S/4Fe-4S cluster protein (DUF4445 family)
VSRVATPTSSALLERHGRAAGSSAPRFVLSFPQLERTVAARVSETIFQSARRGGVRIVGACGGRGTCGTCMVQVTEGEVDYTLLRPHAADVGAHNTKWIRACQAHVYSDCTIEVAPRSLAPVVRAEVGSSERAPMHCAPAVTTFDLTVAEASIASPTADADRLLAALPFGAVRAIDVHTARQLPAVLRAAGGRVRARVRDAELIDVRTAGGATLGLAIDLGTTNAAAFLIDLERGTRIASVGIENPQVAWGADVISRLNHAARTSEGGAELQAAGIGAINALAHDLCHSIGAQATDIVDVAVCGNTAMHHLLLGLPVAQLGRAPFVAAVRAGMDVKARDLGIAVCSGANVHFLPNVMGFVGGDHVAALLATEDLWTASDTSLVMDIGTNTEISLVSRGEIFTASCPSGPALEGGHISCGMRAADGAIEGVALRGGRLALDVIGAEDAVGVCGSGVVDALAMLRRAGAVDIRGTIISGHPFVDMVDGKRSANIAPGVSFTQDDVRSVQLAKAAIRAGSDILLGLAGLCEADIGRLIIAGAFGSYIKVPSGITIGLFPNLPVARFEQVGNAAGLGVQRVLASTREREHARELATRCHYVELSSTPGFQKTFVSRIGFH